MSITSMTGFARRAGTFGEFQWAWELKSVNGKGLDVRSRIPNWLEGLDLDVKKEVSKALGRGSVFVHLDLEHQKEGEKLTVNKELLDQILDMAHEYEAQPNIKPATLDGILRIKGVLTVEDQKLNDEQIKSLRSHLLGELIKGVGDLVKARDDEGEKLEAIICDQLAELEALLGDAIKSDGARLAFLKKKLQDKVNDLLGNDNRISEDRLEQEVAILAVKADIREEIDRLHAHFEGARELISQKKSQGRKLDFLCQELNREVNTICSKSGDVELTRIGLAMKALIDQFREQIQNVE